MNRCLVLADQTLGGRQLTGAVQDRVDAGTRRFIVVACLPLPDRPRVPPTVPSLAALPLGPDAARPGLAADDARDETARRLDVILGRIRAIGGDVAGQLGDPDPLTATGKILEEREITEIILSALPASRSRWLRVALPRLLRRHTGLPVSTVESEEQLPDQQQEMRIDEAKLLADRARPQLCWQGYEDEQIRRWAQAFIQAERAGSVETFLTWVRTREAQLARRVL